MQCPQCKVGTLRERNGKYGAFMGCSNYPKCTYILKEKVGGYPNPKPNAPERPITSENKRGGEIIVLEEIKAVSEKIDKMWDYIFKKLS